jgi:hypothetical protein
MTRILSGIKDRMKHHLFIKDNESAILSVIRDNMRRGNIICSSRQ